MVYKAICEKTSIQIRDGPIKRTEQGRDGKTQEHYNYTLLWNDGDLLSGLQRNALVSLVLFVVCTCIPHSFCCVQSELGMQVHCIEVGEEGAIIPY